MASMYLLDNFRLFLPAPGKFTNHLVVHAHGTVRNGGHGQQVYTRAPGEADCWFTVPHLEYDMRDDADPMPLGEYSRIPWGASLAYPRAQRFTWREAIPDYTLTKADFRGVNGQAEKESQIIERVVTGQRLHVWNVLTIRRGKPRSINPLSASGVTMGRKAEVSLDEVFRAIEMLYRMHAGHPRYNHVILSFCRYDPAHHSHAEARAAGYVPL